MYREIGGGAELSSWLVKLGAGGPRSGVGEISSALRRMEPPMPVRS